MISRLLLVLGVIFFLIPLSNSRAESFQISGDEKDWFFTPGSTLSYFLNITNHESSSVAIAGWSLKLHIQPELNAKGNLFFNSVSEPTQNYLFEGISSDFGPPFSGPSDTIDLIGALDQELIGVKMPFLGINKLLKVDFIASDDAQGRFDLEILPEDGTTSYWVWYDQANDAMLPKEFNNIPFNSASVMIGSVLIQPVPEPSGIRLILIAFGFLAAYLYHVSNRRDYAS